MARLMSALLIFLSGTAAGLSAAESLRERAEVLEQLCLMCRQIILGLSGDMPAAEELFARLCRDESLSRLDFLRADISVSIAVSLGAAAESSAIPVDDRVRDLLSGYFKSFGSADLETEIKKTELLLAQLVPLCERAREKYRASGRLYRLLGASLGAMTVLVLC